MSFTKTDKSQGLDSIPLEIADESSAQLPIAIASFLMYPSLAMSHPPEVSANANFL